VCVLLLWCGFRCGCGVVMGVGGCGCGCGLMHYMRVDLQR